MPIISISKIQHRYGLRENLPQLSAAEFGWAIDQRRLYIGNGPTSEGSPSIGNTEILTQYSNLLEVAENSYSYKDIAAGYEAITGESLSAPTTRSLQAKLDDFASVRDYGAKGDGLTNDTGAIRRAFADLYTRDSNVASRRVLYFPAGTYIIDDTIKIPTFATVQGEGKNCTIIKSINPSLTCVARLADSKLNIGASVGSNNAILPSYISINDITFSSGDYNVDTFIIDSASSILFRGVGFTGGLTSIPIIPGSQATAIKIFSSAINNSKNIIFDSCEFTDTTYAAILDDDMQNIVFDKCAFRRLYLGLKISEDTSGTGSSVKGPIGLRITNSLFDKIYNSAVVNYKTANIVSSFNTFLDVGNRVAAILTYPVMIFETNGAASIADNFARSDVDNLVVPRILDNSSKTIYLEPSYGLLLGKRQLQTGGSVTLSNNVSSAITTGIQFDVGNKTQKVHYIATRGTVVRSGILEVTATATGITVSDSFTENGADLGLTLSAVISGSNVIVQYTTTNAGSTVAFTYSVDRNLT